MSQKECSISSDTFKRLYLLNVIAGFRRGSYGLKRLHKVTYIAERKQSALRPFEFKKYYHGQYSDTLDEIKDQLISLGLIVAIPLDTSMKMRLRLSNDKTIEWLEGGQRYIAGDPDAVAFLTRAFEAISPEEMSIIRSTIKEFGYLPEQELLELCYAFPEFNKTEFEDTIIDSDLPDRLGISKLSEDECEELEMALSPKFVSAMKRIAEAMDNSKLDLNRVKEVEVPI
jgi:hypothetical protein